MSARSWHEVKPIALAERASLAKALETAPLEKIVELQAQVQAIDRFVHWFEAGATPERLIGDAAPMSGY